MRRQLPLRLSATGMIGLAALSATHWLREHVTAPAPLLAFVLGSMPNLAAAVAMPLILASFTPRISQVPITRKSRVTYLVVLSFTTMGLCVWELMQIRNDRFVFDIYDLIATGVGSVIAYVAFIWNTRSFTDEAARTSPRGEA